MSKYTIQFTYRGDNQLDYTFNGTFDATDSGNGRSLITAFYNSGGTNIFVNNSYNQDNLLITNSNTLTFSSRGVIIASLPGFGGTYYKLYYDTFGPVSGFRILNGSGSQIGRVFVNSFTIRMIITYTPAYKQSPFTTCITQLSIAPPPGSIMAYFGGGNILGSDDPDGWVIADGASRSNAGDGRYDYIANVLLIGTISGSNYTPPDLRGAFLRGAKRQASSGYGSYAPDVNILQNHATEKHNHGINDPGHGHITDTRVWGDVGQGHNVLTTETRPLGSYDFLVNVRSSTTGITINDTSTNVHDNETRPYNFGVNWIIKL